MMTRFAPSLLAPDEPAAVRVLREAGASDFVFTADHAGKLIPRSLGNLGVAAPDLERHIAWDIGIAGVTERLSAIIGRDRRVPDLFPSHHRLQP